MEDVKTIIIEMDGWKYQVRKIDTTHFEMSAVHGDRVCGGAIWHIGQFKDRECYDRIRKFLLEQ